ncbi:MAG: hypothetical protein ACYC55_05455 [Candidatus Geothermincolia bacterium]
MYWLDWLRTLALFLGLLAALATGVLAFFLWGICRLVRRRSGSSTGAWFLLPALLLIDGALVAYASYSGALDPATAATAAAGGILAGVFCGKCVKVMIAG